MSVTRRGLYRYVVLDPDLHHHTRSRGHAPGRPSSSRPASIRAPMPIICTRAHRAAYRPIYRVGAIPHGQNATPQSVPHDCRRRCRGDPSAGSAPETACSFQAVFFTESSRRRAWSATSTDVACAVGPGRAVLSLCIVRLIFYGHPGSGCIRRAPHRAARPLNKAGCRPGVSTAGVVLSDTGITAGLAKAVEYGAALPSRSSGKSEDVTFL